MECRECGAASADGSAFCGECGAPSGTQPSVIGSDASAARRDVAETVSVAANSRLSAWQRRGATTLAALGALLVTAACALPITGGSTASSIFASQHVLGNALEPVGAAVLSLCAGVVVVTARRRWSLRWLAGGELVAFGIQTFLLFAGIWASVTQRGSASDVGMLGGLVLVMAGGLASTSKPERHHGLVRLPSTAMPVVHAKARTGQVAVGLPAAFGAVLIIWTCALPTFYWQGHPITYFSGLQLGAAFEPVGVAAVAACAGIVMTKAALSSKTRSLSAGMLVGFGIQTLLYFVSWLVVPLAGPAYRLGSANIVGVVGGLMLVTAGVLGAARSMSASGGASTYPDGDTARPPLSEPYDTGVGHVPNAGVLNLLRGYIGIGSLAALGGAGFIAASLYQPARSAATGISSQAIQNPAAMWTAGLVGAALLAWSAGLFIRRSQFSRLMRRLADGLGATVTASEQSGYRLTLDVSGEGSSPEVVVHLALWTESDTLLAGQRVTLYGRPSGVGPLLITSSDPSRTLLGVGSRPESSSPAHKVAESS